eukprot:403358102
MVGAYLFIKIECYELGNNIYSLSVMLLISSVVMLEGNRSLVLIIMIVYEINLPTMSTSLNMKILNIVTLIYSNYEIGSCFMEYYLQIVISLGTVYGVMYRKASIHIFHQIIQQFEEDIENNNNYVAGIVHDLRNPLTVIYSCSELLVQIIPEELQKGELQEIIQACTKNSQSLISMVNNILDYAKVKAKKLELDLQPTNLKELFNNLIDMNQVKAKGKNLKLALQMDEDQFPEQLFIDQSRMTQILVNLISNAIKFTEKGGVQVQANWFPDITNSTNNPSHSEIETLSAHDQNENDGLERVNSKSSLKRQKFVKNRTAAQSLDQRNKGKNEVLLFDRDNDDDGCSLHVQFTPELNGCNRPINRNGMLQYIENQLNNVNSPAQGQIQNDSEQDELRKMSSIQSINEEGDFFFLPQHNTPKTSILNQYPGELPNQFRRVFSQDKKSEQSQKFQNAGSFGKELAFLNKDMTISMIGSLNIKQLTSGSKSVNELSRQKLMKVTEEEKVEKEEDSKSAYNEFSQKYDEIDKMLLLNQNSSRQKPKVQGKRVRISTGQEVETPKLNNNICYSDDELSCSVPIQIETSSPDPLFYKKELSRGFSQPLNLIKSDPMNDDVDSNLPLNVFKDGLKRSSFYSNKFLHNRGSFLNKTQKDETKPVINKASYFKKKLSKSTFLPPTNIHKETSGTLMIQVIDTGIGISKESQEKLFKPFGQASKQTQTKFGGTGLGLWISKMILELMNGSISIESEEGQGTRFIIKLKLKVAKLDMPQEIQSLKKAISNFTNIIQSQQNQGRTKMKKILVLSDVYTVRLIKNYVQNYNFRVTQLHNPQQLLQYIEDDHRRCLFFDYEQAENVLKYIKRMKRPKQFMLIALRQQLMPSRKVSRFLISGLQSINIDSTMDHMIRKPIQQQEFGELFKKILIQLHISDNMASISLTDLNFSNEAMLMMQNQLTKATSAFLKEGTQNQILSLNRQTITESGIDVGSRSPSFLNYASSYFGKVLSRGVSQQESTVRQSKLLIVDDSEFVLKAMLLMAERVRSSMMLNFEIITASNGQEAYDRFTENYKDIKLIFIDIQMPILDGYEATQKIRDYEVQHNLESCQIVALSGEQTTEHDRRCKLCQMNESIPKPASWSQMQQYLSVFNH